MSNSALDNITTDAPKRRGRPPGSGKKSANGATIASGAAQSNEAPKRRGRPPGSKTASGTTSVAGKAKGVRKGKRRGRPKASASFSTASLEKTLLQNETQVQRALDALEKAFQQENDRLQKILDDANERIGKVEEDYTARKDQLTTQLQQVQDARAAFGTTTTDEGPRTVQ